MLSVALAATLLQQPQIGVTYEGAQGPGKGKHIVFLAGDEEYRSEEALPQLAKILAFRHGFKCTVLFSINAQGEIDPNVQNNQPGMEALDKADLCVMLLRFRAWPDAQMKHFVDYYLAGKPILALRTSTHAFNYAADSPSAYKGFSWQSKEWPGGFGKQVLGETWVTHWGVHGKQATRGVIEESAMGHPVLQGVGSLFGTTDVYEAAPPPDAQILVRGQVLAGMQAFDRPATGVKRTVSGVEQPLNEPMMPVVWTRRPLNAAGKTNTILTVTMGAATDFLSEDLRRLLVNGAHWCVDIEPAPRAKVEFVGGYLPSAFGFEGFRKGVRPEDLNHKG